MEVAPVSRGDVQALGGVIESELDVQAAPLEFDAESPVHADHELLEAPMGVRPAVCSRRYRVDVVQARRSEGQAAPRLHDAEVTGVSATERGDRDWSRRQAVRRFLFHVVLAPFS